MDSESETQIPGRPLNERIEQRFAEAPRLYYVWAQYK